MRFALLLLLPCAAFAQTSLVNAALEGSVSDSAGGRMPGVRVTVRELAARLAREATTDAQGRFHFAELPVGTYEVLAAQPGFARYRHAGVMLQLGSTARLDIVLQSAAVTTQVTVTSQPSPIDPAQTSVTSYVDAERIEELPVESRNYLNFTLLAPGVSSSPQQPGKRSLAPLPDSGFTFGGLRGRSNNVTIDGLDNNDEYVGGSRTELSLETVQEFQVVNAGLSAETGGASGGSINVITRTGADAYHGDAFLFAENGSLNARSPFETETQTPMLHKYRLGLALGGPILRDRTFYYAAFEQEHNRSLDDAFLSPGLVSAVNRILGRPFLTDNYFPASRAETEASFKLSHQLTPRNSLMLRYAFTNNRESGDAFNTLGWTDASARGSSFTGDDSVVGSLTTVFDPQSIGELRFQYAGRGAVLRTNDPSTPGIDIAGLVEFGRPYRGNGSRTERHQQAAYTWSRASGNHLWKAGATVNRIGLDAAMEDGFGGYYIYATLADFAAGRFAEFRKLIGSPNTNFAVTNYGGFLQDHWSATRKLSFDLGVRYDFEQLPGRFNQDIDNFSPRIGLAYRVAPGWVARAGYGIFFDRYVLAELNRAMWNAYEQVIEPGFAPVRGVYTADPRLATPYSQQSSFAIEHLLASNLTATATFLDVRGVKLARTVGFQLQDSASSTYTGASLTLNRRMSDELEFSASYTLSKTYDDASDYTEQPQNPLDLAAERGLSLQQQQQRFVFNALWELPIGDEENGRPPKNNWITRVFNHLELAPIFTAQSGRPVDPLTGVDTYHTFGFPLSARPAGFARNSLQTPLFANMDFRVLKYFPFGKTAHLDVVAEAFNLFNHPNVAMIGPIFGPNFLQPLAGAGQRQLQFSLDYEF